jgi:flavin reductase (DIM6/NTAB) family NADH-FMN oxidoreductase RutF
LAPPTVLVSLQAGKANRLLTRDGRFGASILNEAQQSFSTHFSGRTQTAPQPDFIARERVPTLRHCLAWFECEILNRVQVHDHTLFVALVTACGNQQGSPLMYFGSRYHRTAIAV